MSRRDERQYVLDFTSPYHERQRAIEAALPPRPGILEHRTLLRLLLDRPAGDWSASVREIAVALCCGETKGGRVLKDLESWGLLAVAEQRAQNGFRVANRYSIDWPGVTAAAAATRHGGCTESDGAQAPQDLRGRPPGSEGPHREPRGAAPQDLRGLEEGSEHGDVHVPRNPGGRPSGSEAQYRKEGRKDLEESFQNNQNPSFPPSPLETVSPARANSAAAWDDSDSQERAAEGALRQAGLRRAGEAMRRAAEDGWTPTAVLHAVAIYQTHKNRWAGPGALYVRICQWPPDGVDDLATWADPSPAFVRAEREAARERLRDAQAAKDRAEADQDAAYRRDVAAAGDASGEAFAGLSDEELLDLARREFDVVTDFIRCNLRDHCREKLLLRFHAEQSSITNHSI